MPKVAVIIPTYNRAALVIEAIRSVLSQTFTDFEILVIDDGSSDGTAAAVQQQGAPVRYLWQPNSRQGAARNRGLQQTDAEFASFLDSDDLWLPEKLSRDLGALESEPGAALIYSNVEYISAAGVPVDYRRDRSPVGKVLPALSRHNFIAASTVTVRRRPFLDAGGFSEDPDLSGSEDWEAWMRLATAHEFTYCSRVNTRIRVQGERMMGDPKNMQRAMLAALAAVESNAEIGRQLGAQMLAMRASMYHHIAMNYCAAEQERCGRHWLGRTLTTHWPIAATPRFLGTCVRAFVGRRKLVRLRSIFRRRSLG